MEKQVLSVVPINVAVMGIWKLSELFIQFPLPPNESRVLEHTLHGLNALDNSLNAITGFVPKGP